MDAILFIPACVLWVLFGITCILVTPLYFLCPDDVMKGTKGYLIKSAGKGIVITLIIMFMWSIISMAFFYIADSGTYRIVDRIVPLLLIALYPLWVYFAYKDPYILLGKPQEHNEDNNG